MAHMREHIEGTEQSLQVVVAQLMDAGLIEALGMGARRSYLLSARAYTVQGQASRYVRQTDIDAVRYPELVMKLAHAQQSVTTSDVGELLHIGYDQAYYVVSKLVKEGQLKKQGGGRSTHYIPADMS